MNTENYDKIIPNIKKINEYIFAYNCENIDMILSYDQYAKVLDMDKNNLCKKTKFMYPNCPDKIIQAHVFTIQQMLALYMTNNIDNAIDVINNNNNI